MESSRGLFPARQQYEQSHGRESSQLAYAQELTAHALSIPDFSGLPVYHSFSEQDQITIADYCKDAQYARYSGINYAPKVTGVEPMYHPDIIEPSWMHSVLDLVGYAGGQDTRYHWFKPTEEPQPPTPGKFTLQPEPRVLWASRQWEMMYVSYMRERHAFHANFVGALVSKTHIDPMLAALDTPRKIPSPDINKGGKVDAPDLLYDKTGWLLASTLSVLALPPKQCNGDMKRHAIELFAKHYDPNNTEAYNHFVKLARPDTQRLPWSLRSSAELHSTYTPNWRRDPNLEPYHRRTNGPAQLLHDDPKAYVQFVIMRLFAEDYALSLRGHMLDLVTVTTLSEAAQNIVFADDAAHNTVYDNKPALPGVNAPRTLAELLEAGPAQIIDWQEVALEQRLHIQSLEEKLTTAQSEKATAEMRARELGMRVTRLEAQLQNLHTSATSPTGLLAEYGLSEKVPDEMLELLVTAQRRHYNKKLRTDSGFADRGATDPQTAEANSELLKKINADLDAILKSRGLQKNQR